MQHAALLQLTEQKKKKEKNYKKNEKRTQKANMSSADSNPNQFSIDYF